MEERQGRDSLALFFLWGVSWWSRLGLPGFVGDVVVGVDGEVVGLVGVVLGVGVEGADPDFVFGG